MKKRLTASILITSILALCAASSGCGSAAGNPDGTVTSGDTTAADSVPEAPRDNIPDGVDLGGRTVRIYVRGDTLTTEFDSEATADIVDDAIFNRNQTIEERLNVTLDYFANTSESYWDDRNLYMDTVRTSVMANDGSMDIVAGLSLMMPFLAEEGLFFNLLADDVPYLDFTSPWWSTSLIDELAVNNKLYFASGEACLGVIKGTMCFYFNKDMIADLQLESPYDLVTSGKWTIEKLHEMSAAAYSDVNGNSKVDPEDRFGFLIENENNATNFLNSSELRITRMNSKNIPEMAIGEEKVIELVEKLAALVNEPATAVKLDTSSLYADTFEKGQALFSTGEFYQAGNFRDLTFDFGVIPYPKYDEAQTEYYTTPRSSFSAFGIPVTANKNDCAAVLELMASEGYYQVTPAFYEKALKVKYSRDDISGQMFDLIKGGVCYDFGSVYSQVLVTSQGNGINVRFRQTVCEGLTTWTSLWAAEKEHVTTKLNECIDILTKLEQ